MWRGKRVGVRWPASSLSELGVLAPANAVPGTEVSQRALGSHITWWPLPLRLLAVSSAAWLATCCAALRARDPDEMVLIDPS